MSVGNDALLALSAIPLLRGLDQPQLAKVASCAERREFAPGGVLCRRGTTSWSTLLVIAGRATAIVDPDDLPFEIGPRVVLSELAMVVEIETMATVIAETTVSVLQIDQAAMVEVLTADPQLAEPLIAELTRRMHATAMELEAILESANPALEHSPPFLRSPPDAHVAGPCPSHALN